LRFKYTDSDLFNQVKIKNKIVKSVQNIDMYNDVANEDQIRDINFTIKQRINRLSAKEAVLELLNDNVFIIFNNKKVGLPVFINNIETKSGERIIIDTSNHASSLDNIIPSKIFGLLQNGLIIYNLNGSKGHSYLNNANIMKDSAFIYSRMVNKVFDKVYGSNMDDFRRDLLLFVFAKFFLVKMTGRVYSDSSVDNIAYRSTTQNSTERMINQFEKDILTEDSYSSLFNLINDLSKFEPFSKFKARTLVEQYVRMYGEGALLSLDYLPAFYQTIFGVHSSSFLVKDSVINNLIDEKLLSKLYMNFFTLR